MKHDVLPHPPVTNPLQASFANYRRIIEEKIQHDVGRLGSKNPLRDACQYALLSGGKRFRPAIVLMVAKALSKGCDALQAALAVEFFHCASLVADDLPCMDDDDVRRDKPTLHKVYGEATALLVTYALIAGGYEYLALNARTLAESGVVTAVQSDRICVLALSNATHNTGIFGATGGQYLDIFPPDLSEEALSEVLIRKTVSLFEISFVLGWLYGGGDSDKLDKVKALAYHFGMAFQIADDIQDLAQDAKNERLVNMAAVLGVEGAVSRVKRELDLYNALLVDLGVDSEELRGLASAVVV